MICDIDQSCGMSSHNGKVLVRHSDSGGKTPERTPFELLAWAILERATDDLAVLCRWGLITPQGRCMPRPTKQRLENGYPRRELRKVAHMTGPNDHKELKEFFAGSGGQVLADLVGWNVPLTEVWALTLKHQCGRRP